jgi:hypothetical protein
MSFRLLFLLLFALPGLARSQTTVVRGMVYDGDPSVAKKTPLIGANVLLKGTQIGAITDLEGRFELKTDQKPSHVRIQMLNYADTLIKIRPGTINEVKITLPMTGISIKEFNFRYKRTRNPALVVIDSVKKYRRENDPFRFESVEATVYVKNKLDAYNLPEKIRKSKVGKIFQSFYDLGYQDTLRGDTNVYYPFMLIEMVSNIHRKRGFSIREVIHKFEITGVENDNFATMLGATFQNFNFYDDNQLILGKNFVGPLSPFGSAYYKYVLEDSLMIGNMRCYEISFRPLEAVPREMVYDGKMWVHDKTWGVRKVELKMNRKANVNFIAGFRISQEFELDSANQTWILRQDNASLDINPKDFVDFTLNIGDKDTNYQIVLHRTRHFKNYIYNQPPSSIFPTPGAEVTILNNVHKSKAEWDSLRPIALSGSEGKIDSITEDLKKNTIFRSLYRIGDLVASGFWNFGWVGIGPIYELWSMNEIEGHRIKFGGRTSDSISRRFFLESHIIYGTLDQRFKWDFSGIYHINKDKDPWRMIGWKFRQDIEQLGLSTNQWRPDNLLGTFLRRRRLADLSYIDEGFVYYEHDWFTGLNSKITVNWMRVYDTGTLRFGLLDPQNQINSYLPNFARAEIRLETEFAYGQQWLRGRVKRRALRGEYPVVKLEYTLGVSGVLGSDYNYHALRCSIADRFRIRPLGYTDWEIRAGKIFGQIPYPLMEIHLGNDTYMFDRFGFNLMNYFEFVSDQWVTVRFEHFFDGLFFNKIPGLRKLKWRETIGVRAALGSISSENRQYMALPPNTYELVDQRTGNIMPYVEMNVGIENIFNLLRFDFHYRFTHQNGPDPLNPGKDLYPGAPNWGITAQISVKL